MQHGTPVRPLTPSTEGGSRSSASVGPICGGTDEKAIEEGVDEESLEEARRPRVARRRQMPTKAEYDSHMTLHADYRDWCPDCVAGRGISHQYRSSKNERTGREFSLDYAFMKAEDVGKTCAQFWWAMTMIPMGYGHWQLTLRNHKAISAMGEGQNR